MKLRSIHEGPHKYERMKVGKNDHEIYKCMFPDCPHYLPSLELAIGRLSLCWGIDCHNTVEMTRDMVSNRKTVKPMCESCKEERKKRLLALQSVPLISEEEENYEGEEYEE